MSMINLFLQKRKMHESNHGIVMIVTAYVLSVMMLVLGSDIFYNINTTAAGLNMDTKEETQEIATEQLPDLLSTDLTNTDLPNTDLPNSDLSNTDLPNAELPNAELLNTELPNAELSNTELSNTDLPNKELPSVELLVPKLLTGTISPYALAETAETGLGEALAQEIPLSGDTIWLLGSAMSYKEYDSVMEQISTTERTTESTTERTSSLSTKETESSSIVAITEKEVDMLERIVEAEATGEDMTGKILVANVVVNRMVDEDFPDTIEKVIFQKVDGDYQFSPVTDERYWSVKVTKKTKAAVQRALQGEDYSEGALYFIARKRTKSSSAKWFDQHLEWLFKHGGHEFYK